MERKTVGSLPGYAYAAGAGSPLFSVAGARPAFAVASLTRPKSELESHMGVFQVALMPMGLDEVAHSTR